MAEISFHTTYSDNYHLFARTENGFQSSIHRRGCHRFGFNHAMAWQAPKENDNEVKGIGNSIDFGARIYDSRLGRWMSIDPYTNFSKNWTPYHYCMDSPISMVDIDGKWNVIYIYISREYVNGYNGKVCKLTDKEVKEIQDRCVAAFLRTDISYNGDIVFVSEPMETEYLDQTDVSVQITSIHDLNDFVGTPDGGKSGYPVYEYESGACGRTPNDVNYPVGVYLGGYNVPDYIAYQTMHEVVHRLCRLIYSRYLHVDNLPFPKDLSDDYKAKWGYMGAPAHDDSPDDGINLMNSGFDMEKTFGDKPLEEWPQEYFNITQDRRDRLAKAFGNRNLVPTDNASKRKSAKTGKDSTVTRRVHRKKSVPKL